MKSTTTCDRGSYDGFLGYYEVTNGGAWKWTIDIKLAIDLNGYDFWYVWYIEEE